MKSSISNIRRERGSGVLNTLRDMAISYQFRPGERISEIELAERLGVSRTPVREALARLVTDGFLVQSSRGVMRRSLEVKETMDLYEARQSVERECLRLAHDRASEAQLDEALNYLEHSQRMAADTPIKRLVELDEGFHLRIAAMADNAELLRILSSLNERIRFIRWIDMESIGRDSTQQEHMDILSALRSRDRAASIDHLDAHIGMRRDQIVDAITKGLARIYLQSEQATESPDRRDRASPAR
jgi:DNA-binding GntR family transcriptional regulator